MNMPVICNGLNKFYINGEDKEIRLNALEGGKFIKISETL